MSINMYSRVQCLDLTLVYMIFPGHSQLYLLPRPLYNIKTYDDDDDDDDDDDNDNDVDDNTDGDDDNEDNDDDGDDNVDNDD